MHPALARPLRAFCRQRQSYGSTNGQFDPRGPEPDCVEAGTSNTRRPSVEAASRSPLADQSGAIALAPRCGDGDHRDEPCHSSPTLQIARLLRPSPSLCLFGCETRVVEPAVIQEVAIPLRTGRPGGRGNRANDLARINRALPQRLLGSLPFVDIDVQRLPADRSGSGERAPI